MAEMKFVPYIVTNVSPLFWIGYDLHFDFLVQCTGISWYKYFLH